MWKWIAQVLLSLSACLALGLKSDIQLERTNFKSIDKS